MAATLQGVTFVQYQRSYTLRRTAERAVQIVSEAARALPAELLGRFPDAPWRAIIGIGNVLRHEYQHIDDQLLWEIVTIHFPMLRPIVLRMLGQQ